MKKNTHKDIENDVLHKKLERILTRNWWPGNVFNEEEFRIYCTAVAYEADLFRPGFIGSKKYCQLVKMSDSRLREYLKRSNRIRSYTNL